MNLESVITAQTNLYRAGMENSPAQRKLDLILRMYEETKADPNQRLTTKLALAIEAAKL